MRRSAGSTVQVAVDACRGLSAAALAVLCGLVVWTLLPCLLGWSPHVVLTGSMAPRIQPGDVVLTQPVPAAAIQPGQVVLFEDPLRPGRTVVHRTVRRNADGNLITRGDANATEDSTPVAPSAVRGLPRLRVPYIGRPMLWARQQNRVAVAASGGLLVAASLLLMSETGGGPPRARQPGAPSRTS